MIKLLKAAFLRLFLVYTERKTIRELATSALMQEIWLNLWEHVAIKNTDTYSYFSASSQVRLQKKIITVSNETGFSNVDYFGKIFKKRYHLTPTEYRKNKDYIVNTASPYVIDQ